MEKDDIESRIKLIANWTPKSDVWPFSYGLAILAGATASSSFYFNNYYRRAMKLSTQARYISLVPNVVLPTLVATGTHLVLATSKIVAGRIGCWTCLEVRAATGQLLVGVGQALALSSLMSYFMAIHYYTVPAPSPREIGRHWWSISRTMVRGRLPAICVAHLVLVSILTHQEMVSIMTVDGKLRAATAVTSEELNVNAGGINEVI